MSCNVCGGDESDHHLVVHTERVFGATVWVYDDGFARVVPWLIPDPFIRGGDS